jgi:FkbM family methyltransferase
MPDSDLIFDVGMHRAEDTAFYLAKGFRVVAIEANPTLCAEAENRFATEVADGRLVVLNIAIDEQDGEITFYENENTIWSTIHDDWRQRNEKAGFATTAEHRIQARTLASVIAEYGVPHYVKIDIEGADLAALASLADCPVKPRYVSIESDKTSFRELRRELDTFTSLGYGQFKVVPQRWVGKQKLPNPPLEGDYVDYTFPHGSSGSFGEEAPGSWMPLGKTIDAYKRVFLGYALRGDDPFIRSRVIRKALGAFGFHYNWHDTHAKLG